jgi:hypothetical protein
LKAALDRQSTRGATVKITEQSQSRLVAQRSPYGPMIIGALFVVSGAIWAVRLVRDGSSWGLLVCLAFAALGAFEILATKRVAIVAERSLGTVSIAWRSLLGSGEQSVNIADVDRITYREFTSTWRTNRGRETRREDTSMLVLKDGTSMVLDKEQTSVYGWFQTLRTSSDRVVDTALSDFIGVPLIANGLTHTPISAVQSGLPTPTAAFSPEQAPLQAAAPVTGAPPAPATGAPSAPPAAAPMTPAPTAAPLSGPGSSPYWAPTPPPWARSK